MDIAKPGNQAPIREDPNHGQSAIAPNRQSQSQVNGSTAKPSTFPPPGTQSSFATSNVQRDHTDLVLLICALCSGLIDGSVIVAYTTFVGFHPYTYDIPIVHLTRGTGLNANR